MSPSSMSLNLKSQRLDRGDAPDLFQRLSPVRRSGSPLRRKQISELEAGIKRPRLAGPETDLVAPADPYLAGDINPRKSPAKMAHFDLRTTAEDSALHHMADAVDRVATSFTLTATSLRDMKLHQQQFADELAEIRKSIRDLQKEITRLAANSGKCHCQHENP